MITHARSWSICIGIKSEQALIGGISWNQALSNMWALFSFKLCHGGPFPSLPMCFFLYWISMILVLLQIEWRDDWDLIHMQFGQLSSKGEKISASLIHLIHMKVSSDREFFYSIFFFEARDWLQVSGAYSPTKIRFHPYLII